MAEIAAVPNGGTGLISGSEDDNYNMSGAVEDWYQVNCQASAGVVNIFYNGEQPGGTILRIRPGQHYSAIVKFSTIRVDLDAGASWVTWNKQ